MDAAGSAKDHDPTQRHSVVIQGVNLPAHTRATICGFSTLRGLVSKNKLRFVGEGVDLDLSYITDRLIAMGYPSLGAESCYRNPMMEVRAFLEERHPSHYRIWNLCSEREYGAGSFDCEIERFAWPDHTPPSFALVRAACESLDSWLFADPANVAAIHCKAGKGRTGTLIAAYLLHAGVCASAAEAITLFGNRRTRNGRGITIPSQQRLVRYYGAQLAALHRMRAAAAHASSGLGGFLHHAGAGPTSSVPGVASTNTGGTRRSHFPATGVITRIAQEPAAVLSSAIRNMHTSSSSAEATGPAPRTLLSLTINRDWERRLGLDLAPDMVTQCPTVTALHAHRDGEEAAAADALLRAARDHGDATGLPFADADNSVVPVPISALVRVGDELTEVNGEAVAHRQFKEVVALLRGAIDPLSITLARRIDAQPATPSAADVPGNAAAPQLADTNSSLPLDGTAAPATAPAEPPSTAAAEYRQRVSRAIGPWASVADARVVPVPSVQLQSVLLSHTGGSAAGELVLQIYGGPQCCILLYDSATQCHGAVEVDAPSLPSAPADDAPQHDGAAIAPSAGSEAAEALPLAATAPPSRKPKGRANENATAPVSASGLPAALWCISDYIARDGGAAPLLSGDVKLVIRKRVKSSGGSGLCGGSGSRKPPKPLAQVFLHTACLPLPTRLIQQLEGVGAAGVAAGTTECGGSSGALEGRPGALPPSSAASSPAATITNGPTANGASPEMGVCRPVKGDVTGVPQVSGTPTLGACYTAAVRRPRGAVGAPTASASTGDGAVTYFKSELDFAVKDKKHARFPAGLSLTLSYRPINLPREALA